jgi:hypothetical protein
MTIAIGMYVYALLLAMVREHPPPKPKVELTVTPRITTADIVDGRIITATLIIRNADEALWCPEIDWEWNGQHSSQTSDCVPFEESDVGEREVWTQVRRRRFFGSGTINIVVRLIKGGKVVRKVEAQVPIQ